MKKIFATSTIVTIIGILLISFSACKKGDNPITTNQNPGENTGEVFSNSKRVKATFLGKILKEDGAPAIGANVKTGNHSTTTDDNGLFIFHDINTPQHASVITAEMDGFFKAYRTLSVLENEDNPVRIILIEKGNAQSFDASMGGTITLSNNGKIVFPANAIVVDATNNVYSGTVNVTVKDFNADNSDFGDLSPGTFRALTSKSYEKAISMFGFMAVELSDQAGNKLQLADGKSAELHAAIPSALVSIAPNELSLMSMEENIGMWREEATAKKIGNEYVGELSHFSYWSFGALSNPVAFQATIVDQNNLPMANHTVRLTATGFPTAGNGVTNSSGTVTGFIPGNTSFVLECLGPAACSNTLLHTQNFNTASANINLGTIQISTTSTVIQGSSQDCSSTALPNSVVNVLINGSTYQLLTDALGDFTLVLPCTMSNTTADITAFDFTNIEQGTTNVSINGGAVNNVGAIAACGNLSEYISWTSVGSTTNNYSITKGVNGGSCSQYLGAGSANYIDCRDATSVGAANIIFEITGPANTTGPHSIAYYQDMFDHQTTLIGNPTLTFTTYGPVGAYMEGSFSATMTGANLGNRTVTGNFRVKRTD